VSDGLAVLTDDAAERSWLAPRLAALLGGGSIGTFARDELFAAWATFFERVSDGTEIVFLVDDAHHADEGLLAFIEYLLETATFPCMVVLLTRPGLLERRPALATNRRSAVLHLPALEPKDMSALVNGLVSGLSPEVSAALVTRAEGVPLYAVETVRSLIDRDLVIPRGGHYVLSDANLDLSVVGAPASLQTLIAARLDALLTEQRLVVSQASILGASFTHAGLTALCPGVDIDSAVSELLRLQIFTKDTNRLSVEFGQVKFVQSVVRQVAYSTLSRRDRKAGHLAAAHYLQSALDQGTELDVVIAQHYVDAKDAMPNEPDVPELERAAIDLLIKAAERAVSLGVPDDAAAHLASAIEHASDQWVRADLERRLARALVDGGRYGESIEHAERATTMLDELGDDVGAARATASWTRALANTGEPSRAIELARPRFESLRGREDASRAMLELARTLAGAEASLGLDTRETLDTRMRLAERLGDAEELADSLSSLSLHYATTGAPWVSRQFLEAAARLARERELPGALARALVNLSADRLNYDVSDAIEIGTEAIAVSLRTGDRGILSFARANTVFGLFHAGRWTELESLLDEADELWESLLGASAYALAAQVAVLRGLPLPPSPPRALWTSEAGQDVGWFRLADATEALGQGDRSRAQAAAFEAALTFHGASGTSDDFVHAWSLAGLLAAEGGDDEALDELLRLVEEAPSVPESSVRAHWAHLRGLRARSGGAPDAVETALREAIDGFEHWGSAYMRARAQASLGTWLRTQGRNDEADELIAAARAQYAEMGAAALLAQLDGLLDASH
jgi:tetratricopeptide (TPR) repeat protein